MTIGISLGWNCHTTTMGVTYGLRALKKDGYKTCPFDLMVSNYEGIIQCLYDDFKDFTNPYYLKLIQDVNYPDEMTIINTKYNFVHNHESPSLIQYDPYQVSTWKHGKNHFINNNFELLIERLRNRVNNFREYLKSGEHINFLITDFDTQLLEMHTCIQTLYPTIQYSIIRFDLERNDINYFNRHMKGLNVKRLAPIKLNILSTIKHIHKFKHNT